MVTCRGRRRPFRRRRQDLPSFSICILYASITTHFIYPHNNKQTSSLYMYTHTYTYVFINTPCEENASRR